MFARQSVAASGFAFIKLRLYERTYACVLYVDLKCPTLYRY